MPYECDHCGEQFQLKLKKDEKIDPPYFCQKCDEMFEFIQLHKDDEEEEDMGYLDYYSGDYL